MASALRIALVNEYRVVLDSLTEGLIRAGVSVTRRPSADVVVIDRFGRAGGATDELVREKRPGKPVMVLDTGPCEEFLRYARKVGVVVAPKRLSFRQLIHVAGEVAAGRPVDPLGMARSMTSASQGRLWPGRRAFGLSEREAELLVRVADGFRNTEIAEQLVISVDTVKTHLRRTYRKLCVTNRVRAAAVVARHPEFARSDPSEQPLSSVAR